MSAHPRLSLNQATIKYASLDEALEVTAAGGYESIGCLVSSRFAWMRNGEPCWYGGP